MAKRTNVFDLWSQKGKKKWPQTHIDTAKEAEAAYEAGIEIISCEPDHHFKDCLLYTSPSPRDLARSRMPSSA